MRSPLSDPQEWEVIPETLVLLGIPILNLTEKELLDWLARRVTANTRSYVVTTNIDLVLQAWRDPEMHRTHFEADVVVCDGMPLVWFSSLFGPALKERIAGSDLVSSIARVAREKDWSLYAVGAAPGVAERAMEVLKERNPGLQVAGFSSPPVAPLLQMNDDEILENLRRVKPHVLFAALGSPKQEKWIRMHYEEWSVPVAIGVGAGLDFLAGVQIRAPRWLRRIGMEWFWRMIMNPKRLLLRYLLDAVFLGSTLIRFLAVRLSRNSEPPGWEGPDFERVRTLGAEWVPFERLRTSEEAATFRRAQEPAARKGPLVMDLSRVSWLNSLELGILIQLARISRRSHQRLFLARVSTRVERLIRLSRLDRYLQVPVTMADLERELSQMRFSTESKIIRLNRVHHRLQLILPPEFTRENVKRARDTFKSQWSAETTLEVVIDARKMEFIDAAGSRLLMAIRRMVELDPKRTLWLLGFSDEILETMKRDGLDYFRIDKRKTFRRTIFPT